MLCTVRNKDLIHPSGKKKKKKADLQLPHRNTQSYNDCEKPPIQSSRKESVT